MATTSDWTGRDTLPEQFRVDWGEPIFMPPGPDVPHARRPPRVENIAAQAPLDESPVDTESRPLTAVHCTIVVVDIEGFGDYRRNNTNQVRIRRGLYGALRRAFDAAGIPWDSCWHDDRGDGVLILAPAGVPKALFADQLPDKLTDALIAHNKSHPPEEQIRLRLALHAGEVFHDEHGVTSSAVNHTFRILDAEALKSTLAESTGVLAIIGSSWFFEEVIRHSDWSQSNSYVAVDVSNKETLTQAWIRMVGRRRKPRG